MENQETILLSKEYFKCSAISDATARSAIVMCWDRRVSVSIK
jgi:hypothetical protein